MKAKSYRDMSPEEQQEAVAQNAYILDENYEEDFMRFFNHHVYPYANAYFRTKIVGFDDMPSRHDSDAPIIYSCNHAGLAFAWDAMMFASEMYEKYDYELDKLFRFLSAPAVLSSRLLSPFLLDDFWGKAGCIKATTLNFDTLMHNEKTNILNFPEGIPGISKGFPDRYKLQTFSTSMIRMAIKHDAQIVGISSVNAEYINPYCVTIPALNKMVQKVGIPYLPIGLLLLLLPFCPWLFFYSWPAKLTFVRGKTYRPFEMAGNKNIDDLSEDEIAAVRDELQAELQKELDLNVEKYGKDPFKWKELWQNVKKKWKIFPLWTPLGFPMLFTERYNAFINKEEPMKIDNTFSYAWKVIRKHPFVLSYYIPVLGWIPIIKRGLGGRDKNVKQWTPSAVAAVSSSSGKAKNSHTS